MLLVLHKKWRFPLRIFSVNATKSLVSCGFTEEALNEHAYNITFKVLIIPWFLEITLKGSETSTRTSEVCFNLDLYHNRALVEVYSPL